MIALTQNEGKYPPPHARYLVERDHRHFVATSCYGMHAPWWGAMTATGEVEPVEMWPTDRWAPLSGIVL